MPTPFAHFDRDSSSWRTCQVSLLEDSGECCTTWPKQGTWDLGFAYELRTWGLRTDENDSSSLLPTPMAFESTPTDDFIEEVRENMGDPFKRMYLPGRKYHTQRTLSRMVPALLPTPGSNDSTGAEGPTRDARREEGRTGGPSLRDLPHLLPTPTTSDGQGATPNRRAKQGHGQYLNDLKYLLPTPTVQDGENTAGPSQFDRNTPPLNAVATTLLPTPMANPDNPGSGGELRAALTHGPGRRNETGIDTMGRPNEGRPSKLLPTPTNQASKHGATRDLTANGHGFNLWDLPHLLEDERLLPTPQAADGVGGRMERGAMRNHGKRPSGAKATLPLPTAIELCGELTNRPFASGNDSSDAPHPDQLTIEDG